MRILLAFITTFTFLCHVDAGGEKTIITGQLYQSPYDESNYLMTQDSLILFDENQLNNKFKTSFEQAYANAEIKINSSAIVRRWRFVGAENQSILENDSSQISRIENEIQFTAIKLFSWNKDLNLFQAEDRVFEINAKKLNQSLRNSLRALGVGQRGGYTVPLEAFDELTVESNEVDKIIAGREEYLTIYRDTIFIVGSVVWIGGQEAVGIQAGCFLVLSTPQVNAFEGVRYSLGSKISAAVKMYEVRAVLQNNEVLDVYKFFGAPIQRNIFSVETENL